MSCDDCFKGTLIHEENGKPVQLKGQYQKISGITTYVSLPSGDYDQSKAIVFAGDVFGFYNNSLLLNDYFAANGYACYFPDYLHGDQIEATYMNNLGAFDVASWRINHSVERTREGIDPLLKYLREELGVKRIAGTGYCFGGKYIVDLAIENSLDVAVVSHPSGVKVPEDLDSLIAQSKAPLLINACEFDQTWPAEFQTKATELLGSNYKPGFKQNYYAGCRHGFATRGNPSVELEKIGKEGAAREAVEWFKKYL